MNGKGWEVVRATLERFNPILVPEKPAPGRHTDILSIAVERPYTSEDVHRALGDAGLLAQISDEGDFTNPSHGPSAPRLNRASWTETSVFYGDLSPY